MPSAVPCAATDRADHAASVPPAALRTQSTRRADEPPGLSHVQTARRRGPPADHASSSQSDEWGAPHFARDARDSAARWRSDRRGGGRGRAAGGGGGAAVRLRTFAIARAPRASTLSLTSAHPPHPSPTLHIAAACHVQLGHTPLHYAAQNSSSVAVVQALIAAYPEAATATDEVRRPHPAACIRGHQRSS